MIIEKTSRKESKSRRDGRKFMSPLRGLPSKFNEISIVITSLRDFAKVSNTYGREACASEDELGQGTVN